MGFRGAFFAFSLSLLVGCGQERANLDAPPGGYGDGYGQASAANLSPEANFRVGSVDRFFNSEHLARCIIGTGGNQSQTLEVVFNDQANGNYFQLDLAGFNPENQQHQITGRNRGGNLVLGLQGRNGQNRYEVGNNPQCKINSQFIGQTIRGYFSCTSVTNNRSQSEKASGSFVCQVQAATWSR